MKVYTPEGEEIDTRVGGPAGRCNRWKRRNNTPFAEWMRPINTKQRTALLRGFFSVLTNYGIGLSAGGASPAGRPTPAEPAHPVQVRR